MVAQSYAVGATWWIKLQFHVLSLQWTAVVFAYFTAVFFVQYVKYSMTLQRAYMNVQWSYLQVLANARLVIFCIPKIGEGTPKMRPAL